VDMVRCGLGLLYIPTSNTGFSNPVSQKPLTGNPLPDIFFPMSAPGELDFERHGGAEATARYWFNRCRSAEDRRDQLDRELRRLREGKPIDPHPEAR